MAKVKGSAVDGAVRFLAAQREAAEPLLPTHLLHYLDETISTASWYPEEDLVELIRVILRLIPGKRDQVLEQMGRTTAREHLERTYTHLIEHGGPRNLGIRAFTLWGAMHDSGEMHVIDQSIGSMRLSLSGYVQPSEELCKISRGYILEVLLQNGIDAETKKLSCAVRGDDACVWDFFWDPESVKA
ncbi:MAG TPA: hypothetical protein VKB65_02185 [Myxococcota bacterium]|nr:hypothetical protein [Myxococcota bacterium]